MNEKSQENINEEKKAFRYEKGKIYFSKDTERKIFFILTIVMLLWGIFSKSGLF